MMRGQISYLCLATCLAFFASLASAQTYEIIELGPFPEHTVGFAADINNSGVITGHWNMGGVSFVFFVHEDGIRTDLDLGIQISAGTVSINDAGIIAGRWASVAYGEARAALWNNGVVTDLGTLGGTSSGAHGLNNLGQVVGGSGLINPPGRHAFLWQDGVMVDLNDLLPEPPPWTLTYAIDINDAGQIIGKSLDNGHARAFLMTTKPTAMVQDLGFLPGSLDTHPVAINVHGEIVGSADTDPGWTSFDRPFLWKNGVITELGALGRGDGSATDINDAHQVVGTSRTQDNSTWHAFIWEEGVMRDLNDLIPDDFEGDLVGASAINSAGQILAGGRFVEVGARYPVEVYRQFLLSPCDDSDDDRICDSSDGCPSDPGKTQPGECGCGIPDSDADEDGALDCFDDCPDDPDKTEPGLCGCGIADTDGDEDGTPDCLDECPADPQKSVQGECGCGVAETDGDLDGAPDCSDDCPDDPDKTEPGVCGCGVSDSEGAVSGAVECGGSVDPPAQREGPFCGLAALYPTVLMFGVLSLLRAGAFRHSRSD
ncbi:MAG: hypothetical protein WBE26_07495 [Phycisphaerae bacterium]